MERIFWIGLTVIVSISLGVTFFAPINEIYKGIAALPSVAGLAAALFQLVRDYSAHKRTEALEKRRHLFNLGATSHMANTVFDKHVEFSEKYLAEVHQCVVTLTREGPTREALNHAGNLYTIRVEYTAWITPEIEEKLMPFESAVRQIGAKAGLVSALDRSEKADSEVRLKAIQEMYDIFSSVMDLEPEVLIDAEATVKEVKIRVRDILGVDKLVQIREFLINEASSVTSETVNQGN